MPSLSHQLKFAVRSFSRRKIYSTINVFGLAIGMAVSLVLWRYLAFENSYDRFPPDSGNTYRILSTLYTKDESIPATGHDLGPALSDQLPEVANYFRIAWGDFFVSTKAGAQKPFHEKRVLYTDPAFLESYGCKIIEGDRRLPLRNSSVVITKSTAIRYFGNAMESIGQTLRFSEREEFIVSAVIDDFPENSHLAFDFIIPISPLLETEFYKNNPRWNNFITYIVLQKGTEPNALSEKLANFIGSYVIDNPNPAYTPTISFQPISQIHYESGTGNINDRRGDGVNTLYFFLLLSIFIPCIAWVNYVNLATAQAIERTKEISIKKILGVTRKELIQQFFTEAFLVNLAGIIAASMLASYLLVILNGLIDKNLSFDFTQCSWWYERVGLFVAGTILSGAYPAAALSSFKPARIFRGEVSVGNTGLSLRKILVVFQFAASLFLLIGTYCVYRQVRFMQQEDKGLATDQMLIVNAPREFSGGNAVSRMMNFKTEIKRIASVTDVTSSGVIPGGGHSWEIHMERVGAPREEIIPGENTNVIFTDFDFPSTYRLRLVSGRMWNNEMKSDNKCVIINEAAIRSFGLKDSHAALGQKLVFEKDTVSIIGVVKNYHWNSFKTQIGPTLLWLQPDWLGQYSIHLSGNIVPSISAVRQLFENLFPGNPFEYYFLDDFFDLQYKTDQQFGKIFAVFAILAVFISCLGLWGLASYATTRRMKEISIRKVLGASGRSLVALLSKQFLYLIIISAVIVLPVTYYCLQIWLGKFAYRVQVSTELFLVPVLLLAIIALTTISFQTVRASQSDPVKFLGSQ